MMRTCVRDRGTWGMDKRACMRACGVNRHAYVCACGVNRRAYVCAYGLNSHALGARLTGEKIIIF
jgi:hypothetical protein